MSSIPRQSVSSVSPANSTGRLVGRYERNLDPKKRLTIPSEWRTALGLNEGGYVYVLASPTEDCLLLLPRETMETRLRELEEKAIFDEQLNAALEMIGENSELIELDIQGRIRISDRLLAYGALKTSVTMKGAFRMAKIWASDKLPKAEAVDKAKLREAVRTLNF